MIITGENKAMGKKGRGEEGRGSGKQKGHKWR